MGDCAGNMTCSWSLNIAPYSKNACYSLFVAVLTNPDNLQVEVPGGRGKPSIIVDKDDGLGKVSTLSWLFVTQSKTK